MWRPKPKNCLLLNTLQPLCFVCGSQDCSFLLKTWIFKGPINCTFYLTINHMTLVYESDETTENLHPDSLAVVQLCEDFFCTFQLFIVVWWPSTLLFWLTLSAVFSKAKSWLTPHALPAHHQTRVSNKLSIWQPERNLVETQTELKESEHWPYLTSIRWTKAWLQVKDFWNKWNSKH